MAGPPPPTSPRSMPPPRRKSPPSGLRASSIPRSSAPGTARRSRPTPTSRRCSPVPDIHVVDITSYPNQHAAQFIAAARAGKHIIVEKPLAIEWSDILAMKRAAEESGRESLRLFRVPLVVAISRDESRASTQGLVGTLHYGEVDYYHGIGPWYGQYRWNTKKELGGSALLTAGCHALDALLLCMGSEVEEVTSYSAAEQRTRSSRPTNTRPARRRSCGSPMARSANPRRWSIASSPTTSTRISSAAKARSSTTSFTPRSSAA